MKRWFIGLSALLYSLCGSACATNFPNVELQLPHPLDAAFRASTGHEGITLGEKLIVYGTEHPADEQMKCHEHFHQVGQARPFNDAAVASGEILDNDRDRMIHWLLAYAQASADAVLEGRKPYDNRLERAAYAACPNLLEDPK